VKFTVAGSNAGPLQCQEQSQKQGQEQSQKQGQEQSQKQGQEQSQKQGQEQSQKQSQRQSQKQIQRQKHDALKGVATKAGGQVIAAGYWGDIAIAPGVARRYAKKNGRSFAGELRVLMLHGVLHLLGYDHESDRGEMDRLEKKLRRRFGIA
jgi:rRNA maturation RNase YbeY